MEKEKGFVAKQQDDLEAQLFRKPSRRCWGVVLLALSLGMIYFGLGEDPWAVPSSLPAFGLLEGVGALFGSLAELMPEDETTLAGILRLWAGLFVVCGFALMVAGGFPGP